MGGRSDYNDFRENRQAALYLKFGTCVVLDYLMRREPFAKDAKELVSLTNNTDVDFLELLFNVFI